ncbi:MAG: hypothetical protein IKQ91_00885 [Oscillospiraceae bacterium]|nr:hypothetical protein [Oscillospiraceae bacterium]
MKNQNKKRKRFFMFILTLAISFSFFSSSLADCNLTAYADYGLNPGISGDTLDLDILNRKFLENASKNNYNDPSQRTYDKRFNDTLKNTSEGYAAGKLFPELGKYLGKGIDWATEKGVKAINDRGKWGLSELQRLGFINKKGELIPEPTKFRRNSGGLLKETEKHIKWKKADRLKQCFERFTTFSLDPKMMDKFGRSANFISGMYGFYQMYENPNIGFNSPFFEFCGMSLKGISNSFAVFAACYPAFKEPLEKWGDAFMFADLIINNGFVVGMVNDIEELARLIDEEDGHQGWLGTFIETLDFLNEYQRGVNKDWQDMYLNVFDWWDYLRYGIEGDEADKLLDEMKRKSKGNTFQANGVGVYKPNIYLYPKEQTEFAVTFARPELLTVSDPLYENGWRGTAEPDGRLYANGQACGYLFYESLTDPYAYQYQEGYVIPAGARAETFTEILRGYGLNDTEIADFNEFWCSKLDAGCDYAMYPQLTDTLDSTMPVTVSPAPDSVGRIWFAFEKNAKPEIQAKPQPFAREGFTVIEWGGFFLRSAA